jgi:hypothetical protein
MCWRGNRIFKRHRTPQEWASKSPRLGSQSAEGRKSGPIQGAIWASAGSGLASWQVFEFSPRARLGPGLNVDPDVGQCVLTKRAAPPQLQGSRSPWRRRVSDSASGSSSEVLPRLARPTLGRRLWIQPQVSKDLLDHRPLEDGGDDLELPGAAVRAALHVDVNALEQVRPAVASRPDLGGLGPPLDGGCSLGGRLPVLRPSITSPHCRARPPPSTTGLEQVDRKAEYRDPVYCGY